MKGGNKQTTIQIQVVVIEPTEHLLQDLLKLLNTLLDSHFVFRRMNRILSDVLSALATTTARAIFSILVVLQPNEQDFAV